MGKREIEQCRGTIQTDTENRKCQMSVRSEPTEPLVSAVQFPD